MQLALLKRKIVVAVFPCLLVMTIAACGSSESNESATAQTTHTSVATSSTTPMPTQALAADLKVTGVDMTVNPASIAGLLCGTNLTVVYTATFDVAPNNTGGTAQFEYTVNNGRSSQHASLNFGPGETTKTFSFNWSGKLTPDNVYPGLGGVMVTSPNSLTSQTVKPSGTCRVGIALQVTSIDMAVNPTSIAGITCGKYLTVTYTATFHVVPNSAGGTVQFEYTVNNGRGSTGASVVFAPGETVKAYSFTWSGNLPPDHTYPGLGGVMVTSPNSLTSHMIAPSGMCS